MGKIKSKINLGIFVLLIFSVILSGCGNNNVSDNSDVDDINDNMENEVIILVVDKNENPIENAKVTFNKSTRMTDVNGKTTFKISDGMYELKVESENFVDYSDSVEVNNDMDNYLVNMRSVEDIAKPKSPKITIQQDGNSITINWNPIIENSDGEKIEIKRYKVYGDAVNSSSGVYSTMDSDSHSYSNTLAPYEYELYVIAIDKYGQESEKSNIVNKISTKIDTREVRGSQESKGTIYNRETGVMKVDYEAEAPLRVFDAKYKGKLLNGSYDVKIRLTEERISKIQKVETYNLDFNDGYAEKDINFTASYEYQITWDYGYHPIYPDDPQPELSIIFDKVPTDLQ